MSAAQQRVKRQHARRQTTYSLAREVLALSEQRVKGKDGDKDGVLTVFFCPIIS